MVLALGAGLWFSGTWRTAQVVREQVGQPLGAATRAEVDIALGVGSLRIGALDQAGNLIAGEIAYPESNRVERVFGVSGDTATFSLRELDSQRNSLIKYREDDAIWDLRLAPGVRMNLNVESGVGESAIDLSQLQVGDLTFKSGVGTTTLTLPSAGQLKAQIEGGVGEMSIRIPAGMAARITLNTGIGDFSVRGNFLRQGNTYISPDFDKTTNRVDLTASSGIGKITIQQISE
jgi:hypothetical protein